MLSESRLPNLMRAPTRDEELRERQWAAIYGNGRKRQSRDELLREFFDGESDRYRGCTLESFETSDAKQVAAVEALREYLAGIDLDRSLPPGLLLYGPCGTGKDHLAIAVCLEAMSKHGLSCGRINGSEWFGDLRDQMDNGGKSEASIIARLAKPSFLLVSDPLPPFGALTQFQATMLYRLVEKRYYLGKPTILTVNVKDGKEAEDRMGAPTWDRLKDGVWVIACNWPSHRKPARVVNGAK